MQTALGLLWRRRRKDLLNEGDEGVRAVIPASHTQTNDAEDRPAADLFRFDIRLTEEDIGA
jgi:hypothetical protein